MNIPKMMKAIVKTKEERGAEYLEVEVPEVGPGEVLVKIKACAVCGTDIHMYQWNAWAAANVKKAYSGLPRIMGHEFSGEVVRVGEGVKKVKVGDRIAAETHVPCGECYLCRTGKQFNCQNVKRFKNGVYADYALIPEFCAEKIPDNIGYDVAALFEPFSVAVHGASYVRMVGDSVAVIGVGPIGLFSIKMAKAMGATTIFASDISEYHLSLAEKAGANYLLNPKEMNVVKEVRDATDGLGAGVVFETSGNVIAIKQAFELLRKSGSMVMIGLPSDPLVLDASSDIVWKGATIYGVHGRDVFTSWEISKNLLGSGKVEIESLITHRFKFNQFKKALELAEAGKTGKVLLLPE